MKIAGQFFDSGFDEKEQLPRKFTVDFESVKADSDHHTKVSIDGMQVGDVINDNARESDGYRFHDVFHYSFATMLGWSPCTRAMLKRKRKSDPTIDEVEDGARATITEESISLIIFNNAKKKNFFQGDTKIGKTLLSQIKDITAPFEVSARSRKDWENTILKAYSLFRDLIENDGGKIHFDMHERSAIYES